MEKEKEKVTCAYKIVCAERKNKDKCPCSLANTKKVQVIFDSMSHTLEK